MVSGIGERPAVVHMRDFGLPGFTTGSGCIALGAVQRALRRRAARRTGRAPKRSASQFIPFEDLRDEWGPARVLHHGTELAGIAPTGPIPPFVSPLDASQIEQLAPVARALRDADRMSRTRLSPADLRSHRWFGKDDLRSFGHRSRAKQAGFSLDDISGKPVIAILNTWSDANPCHTHFRLRAEEVKRGIWQAGGFPMEIPRAHARRDVHEADAR